MSSRNRSKTKNRSECPGSRPDRKGGKSEPKKGKRLLAWAAAATGTALIGLLVTGVLPKVFGQFFNGAQIADSFRPGPDIKIANESVINPFEGVPLLPKVVPGDYQPSSELVSALAHPNAATSTALQEQIDHAGGVYLQNTYIRVILQGNRNEKILILDVRPVQLHRAQPLNGVLFDIGPQGAASNIQMGLDLDQLAPKALNIKNNTLTKVPYFQVHSISLADGEQAVLVVQARTFCYSAQFKLAIDYKINGENKEVIISNSGKPFEVTGYRLGRNNVISYRQMLVLQGNFSVTPPSPSQLFTRAGVGASSCPT